MTKESRQPSAEPENATAVPAAPLWKKAFKPALYVSTALVAPFYFERGSLWPHLSSGKLAIFLAVPLVVSPMSAKLFPTAEEVLAQKGYPAEMVQDLAPGHGKIRVRPDNAWGKAQALFSLPLLSTAIGKNHLWNNMRDQNVLGLAQAGQGLSSDVIYVAEDRLRDLHAPSGKKRRLSYEEEWLHSFLHEVRHVSAENRKLESGLARESDSDYEAARVVIKHLDRPLFESQLMAYKGGSFPDSHDTALYLSARFNGTVAPAAQDMAAANRDAATVLERLERKGAMDYIAAVKCHMWETPEHPCRYTLDGLPLSDLAKQRLGLYFNSLLYNTQDTSAEAYEAESSPKAAAPPPKPTS